MGRDDRDDIAQRVADPGADIVVTLRDSKAGTNERVHGIVDVEIVPGSRAIAKNADGFAGNRHLRKVGDRPKRSRDPLRRAVDVAHPQRHCLQTTLV
jgi:hypothetical protein